MIPNKPRFCLIVHELTSRRCGEPIGQKHFNFISFCIQPRRWAHFNRSRHMKSTILSFLFFTSFAFAETPITFRQLPVGDTIRVIFTSSGCFHNETYEFDFQRASSVTAKVTTIEYSWNEAKQRNEEAKRATLGTVTLSDAEIAGIDRLFTFYRSNKDKGCTTVNHITATQMSGKTVKATESFTDASCATYDMKNLTLLPSIAEKLKPKTK